MSELSNRPVDNGRRVPVVSTVFTGMAGLIETATGGSFAFYAGAAPRRPGRSASNTVIAAVGITDGDREATIEGRAARILEVRKSDTDPRLQVAEYEYEGEA